MVEHVAGDTQCRCAACERAAIDAAVGLQIGRGISAFGHSVLGAGWLDGDGKGGSMTAAAAVAVAAPGNSLAQHALADVFEQLERIGQCGREKCRPLYRSTGPIDRAISRGDALELLRFAQHTLDYARVHLDHLPGTAPTVFELDDRVIVTDDDECWSGTIVGRANDGSFVVQPDDSSLRAVEVDGHDLRRAE